MAKSARQVIHTFTLQHPVTFNDMVTEQITVYKGRLGDLAGARLRPGELDMDVVIKIASNMTGEFEEVIRKLEEEDSAQVIPFVINFLGKSLGTGG